MRETSQGGLIQRTELVERVVGSPAGAVVLVVAPGGYGKSSLVDQLRQQVTSSAYIGVSTLHDDPDQFARAIWASLPAIDDTVEAPDARSESFVARVTERIEAAEGPDLVVFDDVHHVTNPVVLQILADIVWAVRSKRVVVATRRAPPIGAARLKVRRRLVEIDEHDLALDTSEAMRLVTQLAPGADPAVVERERRRLRGWPAGLVLLGLALRHNGGPSTAIELDFDLRSFIVDDVLAGVPARLREFLVELGVLGVFDAAMAVQVTGRADGEQLIAEVWDRRLFIERDRNRPGWLRFHDLFADVLSREASSLGEDRSRALRHGAIDALIGRGELDWAVDRMLSQEDPEMLGRALEANIRNVFWGFGMAIAERMNRIPLSKFGDNRQARIGAMFAANAAMDLDRATEIREAILHGRPWDASTLSPGWFSMDVFYQLMRWDSTTTLEVADLGVERTSVPGWLDSVPHLLVRIHRAWALWLDDRIREAAAEATLALETSERNRARIHRSSMHALIGLASLAAGDGEAARARLDQALADREWSWTSIDLPAVAALQIALATHDEDLTLARRVGLATVMDSEFSLALPMAAVPWLMLAAVETRIGLQEEASARAAVVASRLESAKGVGLLRQLIEPLQASAAPAPAPEASALAVELSDSERKIMRMLTSRMTLREIGGELYLSVNTVKTHTQSIYRKLGVGSRREAVDIVRQRLTV